MANFSQAGRDGIWNVLKEGGSYTMLLDADDMQMSDEMAGQRYQCVSTAPVARLYTRNCLTGGSKPGSRSEAAMGQTAILAMTGERLEAFSAHDELWKWLCYAPKGTILMPRTNWPAVAKTSMLGFRFFAHYSGYPGIKPEPESYAHARLKIDVVRILRSLGYEADVEVPGVSPTGDEWVADVLTATIGGTKVAFEIQLSSQHIADFRRRTERYRASGVHVFWILAEKPVADRLHKAILVETAALRRAIGVIVCDCEEIIPINVALPNKNQYPDDPLQVRFGRGRDIRRMPLAEAIEGLMYGYARWDYPDWKWVNPLNPTAA